MFSRRRTCSRPNPAGGATRKKRSFKKEVTEMDKILTPVPTCLLVGYASGLLLFIPEIRRRHKNPSEPSRPPAPSGSAPPASYLNARHR